MRLRRRSSIFSHLFRCFCSLRSNVYFRRRTFLFLLRFWHLIIIAQNLVPEWLMCLQWQTGERCKLQKPVRNVKTTNSAKLHIANRKHDLVLLFIIICSTYQQPNVGHIIFVIIGEMVRLSVYQSIGSRFLLRSNWMRLWKVSNYCFLRCDYSPPAIAEIWINISAGVDKQKQREKKLWKSYDIIKLPTNDGRKKKWTTKTHVENSIIIHRWRLIRVCVMCLTVRNVALHAINDSHQNSWHHQQHAIAFLLQLKKK